MSENRFPWHTLLFVSVALNLLAVGAVVGAIGAGVRLQREAPQAVVARMPGPRAFLAALPEDMRPRMREELARSWVDTRQARQAAAEARRQAFIAAATEPYDAARVRTAFARVREADQAAIAIFHDRVVNALGEMSAEDRARALEALRTAAPARRVNVGPQREGAGDNAGDAAVDSTRRERREKLRERMRERRERQAP